MTTMTSDSEDEAREPAASPAKLSPSATMLVGEAMDRCSGCGAQLAVDQRYCVECGTRRGKPRFTIARPAPAGSTAATPAPQRRYQSRAVVLLAVIAVLLAVGVGVLIGEATSSSIRQPVKVTITGGSLGGGNSRTGAAGSGAGKNGGSKSSSGSRGSSKAQNQNFFGG